MAKELTEEYEASPEGTFRVIQDGRNGKKLVKIAHFSAWIEEEVTYDDGLETTLVYTICGRSTEDFPPLSVPAEQFPSMNWVSRWGAHAVICAGSAKKDQLREAILCLSQGITYRHVLTHIGWHKDEEGRYAYVHAGGAVGAGGQNTTCQPARELSGYKLPAPPTGDTLAKAVRASLELLHIAPANMIYPLLASVYTAPLGEVQPNDFAIWVSGETGSRKSTVAALSLSHYGGFTRNTLPANFLATANGNELLAYCAKDALLVFDDYAPRPDAAGQATQDATANRLLRGIGDTHGRLRATASGNLRPEKPPRCLPLVTAELPPPGSQSSAARTLLVPWEKGALDLKRLTQAQEDTAELALSMAGYLEWLAAKLNTDAEAFGKQVAEVFRKNRARLNKRPELSDPHGRVIETAAKLLGGFSLFLLFALEKGALTKAESASIVNEAESALAHCAKHTEDFQREEKPAVLFMDTLQALFRQGRVYLQPVEKDMPREKLLPWGWYNPGTGEIAPKRDAECVGWYNGAKDAVYLLPTETQKAVYEYARKAGKVLPNSHKAIGDCLQREGLIIDSDPKRSTARKRTTGKQTRFWVLSADCFGNDEQSLKGLEPTELYLSRPTS